MGPTSLCETQFGISGVLVSGWPQPAWLYFTSLSSHLLLHLCLSAPTLLLTSSHLPPLFSTCSLLPPTFLMYPCPRL